MFQSRSFDKQIRERRGTPNLSKNSVFVIVQLDWTIQNLLKRLDSPIKSGNDRLRKLEFLDRLHFPYYLINKYLKG
jgi:hypothetical protein